MPGHGGGCVPLFTGPQMTYANLTRRLCTIYVEPSAIAPLIASHLVDLDKCPSIYPIGVSEILRRLIGKLILKIAHNDILDTVGTLQLCVGQEAACELSVHAMRQILPMPIRKLYYLWMYLMPSTLLIIKQL